MHSDAIDVAGDVSLPGKPWSGGSGRSGNRKLVLYTIEGADPGELGWPRDWTRWTAAPHLAVNSDRWPDRDWLYQTLPLDVATHSHPFTGTTGAADSGLDSHPHLCRRRVVAGGVADHHRIARPSVSPARIPSHRIRRVRGEGHPVAAGRVGQGHSLAAECREWCAVRRQIPGIPEVHR